MPSKRTGIMLAIPMDETRIHNKWNRPFYVQPKLDGFRCLARIGALGCTLWSSQGNLIGSVPHIQDQIDRLELPQHVVLDGELYVHGQSWEWLASRIKRQDIHPESGLVEYHIFDCISQANQFARLAFLQDCVQKIINKYILPNIKVVGMNSCYSIEEIAPILRHALALGYEGIILRNNDCGYEEKRSTNLMKYKPSKQDEYLIVGVHEEIALDGTPKDTLGAFECEGPEGMRFRVRPAMTAQEKKELWELTRWVYPDHVDTPIGKTAIVKYQDLTDKKIPRFPIMLEIKEKIC